MKRSPSQATPPVPPPPTVRATPEQLVGRARSMLSRGERRLLGITGAPGAGKSTLCAALAGALGAEAALVGMDGFHLANRELERLGRRQRKGAPDTFDVDGYVALLHRLRQPGPEVIYAPVFDRSIEESIGSAVPVAPDVPLVLTEGNYLLLEEHGWAEVRSAVHEVWFLDLPGDVRLDRLVRRHEAFGKSQREAEAWVGSVDEPNAALILATRERADLIVELQPPGGPPDADPHGNRGR